MARTTAFDDGTSKHMTATDLRATATVGRGNADTTQLATEQGCQSNCKGRSSCHPWRELEYDFQELIRLRHGGVPSSSPLWNPAVIEVRRALAALAGRMLRQLPLDGAGLDPEHATQEWFVGFFKLPLTRLKPERPFFPYAYVMLVRICVTMARRERLRQSRELPEEWASDDAPPWRHAADREMERYLHDALRSLPQESQQLIVGRYWQQADAETLGKQEKVTTTSVHGRLHRARRQLHAAIIREISAHRQQQEIDQSNDAIARIS